MFLQRSVTRNLVLAAQTGMETGTFALLWLMAYVFLLRVPSEALPAEVLEYEPEEPITYSFQFFVDTLRATARGSSGGPGNATYEHLKIA